MKRAFKLVACALISATSAGAAEYFVATNGLDTQSGTNIAAPLRTIQAAAAVMAAGDTCHIRGGTYRETVAPVRSGSAGRPLRFQPYSNEVVTVTGLDPVAGWSPYANGIFQCPVTDRVTQVFADGVLMTEARWPNTGADRLRPTFSIVDAASMNGYNKLSTLTDAPLASFANDFWTGAKMWYLPGEQWGAGSTRITDHTGNRLTFTNTSPHASLYIEASSKYFLYGTLNALDASNEWFYDAGRLYFKAPGNADPGTMTVEVRTRRYGFDLSNRSFVELAGLRLLAATVRMTGSNCLVEACTVLYPTPFFDQRIWGGDDGVELHGQFNVVRKCEIAWSWGDGVSLNSASFGNTVDNCLIHDCDWMGGWSALIRTLGTGHTFVNNTIYNTGREGLRFQGATRLRIVSNHVSHVGWLCKDLGHVKTGGTDGLGTVIAYNWLHDHHSTAWVSGVYLDNSCTNHVVHHNVVWNVDNGIRMNRRGHGLRVYNNTLYNCANEAMAHYAPAGEPYIDVRTYNNLSTKGPFLGTDLQKNLQDTAGNIRFVSASTGDFRLQAASTAMNFGRVIAGYTDGYSGVAPDAGAYEYGGSSGVSDWRAGITWTPDWNALPLPVMNVTGSTFDASSSSDADGQIMRYDWDFGDGARARGKTVSHIYTSPGSHRAVLTVLDNLGGVSAFTNTIAISNILEKAVFHVGADLYIAPDGTKYASQATIMSGNPGSAGDDRRAFVSFNLSGLSSHWAIASAKIRLYHVEGTGDDFGRSDLFRITNAWTLSSVTYGHPLGAKIGTLVGNTGPFNQYLEMDVTPAIRDYQRNANAHHGFSLRAGEGFSKTAKYFVSSEGAAAQRPELVVEYSIPDGDGDGIADAWELQYFDDLSTATTNSDWDGDGFSDYAEFIAGTVPSDATSLLAIGDATQGAAFKRVVAWHSMTARSYHVAMSTSLTGAWSNISGTVTATPPVNVYTDNAALINGPVYYRVRLQ